MATNVYVFCAVLLVSLIAQGYSQCGPSNLVISQSLTGKKIGKQPERKVTVINNCHCSQYDIRFSCKGFKSSETIDPLLLSKSGDECSFNNGTPIFDTAPVSFNYTSTCEYPFKVTFAQIGCS